MKLMTWVFHTLPTDSVSPTTYSVSDNIVAFTPAPTPWSRSSLSHEHIIHMLTHPHPLERLTGSPDHHRDRWYVCTRSWRCRDSWHEFTRTDFWWNSIYPFVGSHGLVSQNFMNFTSFHLISLSLLVKNNFINFHFTSTVEKWGNLSFHFISVEGGDPTFQFLTIH